MGKVTKQEGDIPTALQFDDKKNVNIVFEEDTFRVVELGAMDVEVGIVCERSIDQFESIVHILAKSKTLQEAKGEIRKVLDPNIIKAPPEEEDAAPESFPDLPSREAPLEHFEIFKKFAAVVFPDPETIEEEPSPLPPELLEPSIREAVRGYLDRAHSQHEEVKKFAAEIHCYEIQRDERDRLWVFRKMYLLLGEVPETGQKSEELTKKWKEYLSELMRYLGPDYFRPVEYPNDMVAAEEYLAVADSYVKMQKMSDAISSVEQAIGVAANCVDAYWRLGEYHIMTKNYTAAADVLDQMSNMPLAERILQNRTEYFLVYSKCLEKISDAPTRKSFSTRLKGLLHKYNVQLPAA